MKLVVGLGNPGAVYAQPRHKIGFMVADELAKSRELFFSAESKFKAEVARGEDLIIAKPQTFMNLSGGAIQALMHFYKLAPADVWVIFDDVDVPFGRLRIRVGGTSGHQGIRSIIQHVGLDFVRVRVGISLNDRARERSEEYVLKPFNPDEREKLPHIITETVALVSRQIHTEPVDATYDL